MIWLLWGFGVSPSVSEGTPSVGSECSAGGDIRGRALCTSTGMWWRRHSLLQMRNKNFDGGSSKLVIFCSFIACLFCLHLVTELFLESIPGCGQDLYAGNCTEQRKVPDTAHSRCASFAIPLWLEQSDSLCTHTLEMREIFGSAFWGTWRSYLDICSQGVVGVGFKQSFIHSTQHFSVDWCGQRYSRCLPLNISFWSDKGCLISRPALMPWWWFERLLNPNCFNVPHPRRCQQSDVYITTEVTCCK